ncbi:MAG TPA: aminotransferase class III-fold pyridoxal phosphate-dependent enzyme [Gammaproteobacteria bacterium]
MDGAHLSEVYPTLPFKPVTGQGVYLEDANGRRVLDLYGGHAVAGLGYGHPRLTEAVVSQARQLLFQSNAVTMRVRDEAADKLAAFAPEGLDRVFFVNSGAEAVENALKIALQATGRGKVIAMEHSFHGRTAAAGAVSWNSIGRWYGFPRMPMDVVFVPRNDEAALAAAVDSDTAAVIMEPVQGVAGAFDFAESFVNAARRACDAAGALLILDEVQTGMGRLGTPFGADYFGVTPDLMTAAKSLGGGFPCGAVVMRQDLARDLGPGAIASTFGGGPLACAAIVAVLDTIADDNLLANVADVSARIRESCTIGHVSGIQGAGFLLGLRTTPRAALVRDALLKHDILTGTSGDPHILRLLPALILQSTHVEKLVDALEEIADATLQ